MSHAAVENEITRYTSSTGLLSGGEFRINATDPAKVDILAGTGIIIDDWTDCCNPRIYNIWWDDFIGITVAYLAAYPVSAFGIERQVGTSEGKIKQVPIEFLQEQKREFIYVGIAVHPDGLTVRNVDNKCLPSNSSALSLSDLAEAMQTVNVSGNVFYANGASLRMNKSAGEIQVHGVNFKNNKKNPNRFITDEVIEIDIAYTWQDGSGGFNVSPFTKFGLPGYYDDGTGGTSTPNGIVPAGKWTIQKIFYVGASNNTVIHFGTNVYNSQYEAFVNAMEYFQQSQDLAGLQLRSLLIVRGDATELNELDQSLFIEMNRFGTAPFKIANPIKPFDGKLGEIKMVALTLGGSGVKDDLINRGWAICNGTTSASQGITGATIATTPDLQHKFVRMSDDESSGDTGGEDVHTLTIAEMPAHNHEFDCDNAAGTANSARRGQLDGSQITTTDTGGDTPHNNLPSYYELVYFIKVKL